MLEEYRGRESDYGFNVALNLSQSREKEVVSMLVEMLRKGNAYSPEESNSERPIIHPKLRRIRWRRIFLGYPKRPSSMRSREVLS